MGILGKEKVALEVAKHFQTTLVIPDRKYRMMQAMHMPTDQMKTEIGENWIEVIHKVHREARLEEEAKKGNTNFIMICVDFTGFEVEELTAEDGVNYLIPYSQHSNYSELEKFVKSICPSVLKKLVLPFLDKPQFRNRPINNLAGYSGYVKSLARGGKGVFAHFLKSYTDLRSLSSEYKQWMTVDAQQQLMDEFKIPIEVDTNFRKITKKRALEKQIEALTKKDIDIQALGDKIFHSQKQKKRSFAGTTEHKLAVNNTKRLDTLILNMGGKKKLKTTVEQMSICKENSTKELKSNYNLINAKDLAKVKPLSLIDFKKRTRYDPSQDSDLMLLLDNFISKGHEVQKKKVSCFEHPNSDPIDV